MNTPLTRRDLLKFGSGGAVLAAIPVHSALGQTGTPVKVSDTIRTVRLDDETLFTSTLNREDRRFRRAFLIAIRRLRLRGKLTRERFRELRTAIFSSFGYFKNERVGIFIQHLRRDVQEQAGDAWDVLVTFPRLESLVQWLIESWNLVIDDIKTNLEEWKITIAE